MLRGMRGLGLVAMLVAGGTAGAQEAPRPFLGGYLQESRVLYPLRVGNWRAVDEHRYEQSELGVSVRYQLAEHDDRWMDVYFYPSGVQLEPRFVQAFLHEVGQVEGSRRQQGGVVETGEARTFVAPGEFDALLGELAPRPRSVTFAFDVRGTRHHSLLALAVKDMYFVKLRYSAEADALSQDEIRRQGEELLSGFLASVRTFNTGDCWRTLSVEAIPAGAARPDSVMASANDGTDDELWVAEDRVYLKPDRIADEHARASLFAFAMNLHAALRGRCLPPETMDVEVPEGMREIRIEYRAPSRPGDRPALRAPTRGQG